MTQNSFIKSRWQRLGLTVQEQIVLALTALLLVFFSVILDNFLSTGNMINLLRSVAVLGMLSLGMCLVVIGRGVDLAMVATLVVGASWALRITSQTDISFGWAWLMGLGFALASGLAIGAIIAFAEIPAIFTTLAMAAVIFGFGNTYLFTNDLHLAPADNTWLEALGYGATFGVPNVIYFFGAMALALHLLLKKTRFGRTVYAIGENPAAARLAGLPVRPVIVAQYVISALIAYLAGLAIVASNSGINIRLYNSTLVYELLLVVVLGGIGLSGGKGGVRNVIFGVLLVGTLFTGMTIMNLTYTQQNLVKGLVLLAALIADTLINPRDEQTSQQGDI
ncbi:MAG: ABC transporter permease [Rhodobacteraceae bacterium]|uniref:Ribose transport system permease protein n=1 Tax=Salipiger profundus TaxID=1229727 RepID=A0A1U7DA37_9RHOB|nr:MULTISPECIES: ABC transporter permease [Salipiger]APX24930.1 ribose transport system permease protein [Salipiger profundus]MAB07843.1 ABC transporter permease [Paracoccaceae bacterium]GFZ98933.1 ABC transporter permease [Salipiger profundus]SFC94822.1 monosaccharide ABC transporter membrane protein, CUT2 family [Salipiger profundus]